MIIRKLIPVILLIHALGLNYTYGQEPADGIFPLQNGQIHYENIITVDSASKDEIYKAVKMWGLDAFKSQKDVLQADDRETGIIAYKFWFDETYHIPKEMKISGSAEWRYDATMTILIKNGKAKITVTNLALKSAGQEIPILNYRSFSELATKKASELPGYSKAMKKYSTPEILEAQFAEVRRNFQSAHKTITANIESLISSIRNGPKAFNF